MARACGAVYLVEDMDEGKLQKQLQKCGEGPFQPSDFSIGHRGAPLQFPEHTRESYVGVRGIFSDWPATTTYYANCMGLK